MQPKRGFRSTVFLFLLFVLVGCGSPQPAQNKRTYPFQGQTITVVAPTPSLSSLVETYSASWRSREKVAKIDVVSDAAELPNADLVILSGSDMPGWADSDRLAPLPRELQATTDNPLGWMGFLPLYRTQLLVWDRDEQRQQIAYALPILGEAPLCFYRSDWFADSKHRTAFETKYGRSLGGPNTWEEYRQIAEYFHQARADTPSLPALPSDDNQLVHLFNRIASGHLHRAVPSGESANPAELERMFEFYFDLQTGEPKIDSAGFTYALQLMQHLQAFRPNEALSQPQTRFLEGGAVLCVGDAQWSAEFQRSNASKIRDKFDITVVPGGDRYYRDEKAISAPGGNPIPYLGSGVWLGVLPKDAEHSEAALSLLKELGGREISNEIIREPRWGGGVLRTEQLDQQLRWDGFDLDTSRTDSLKRSLTQTLLHPRLRNPAYAPRIPNVQAFLDILAKALRRALTEQTGAQQTLSEVRSAWQKLIDERGKAKHLEDVRISLGFLPN